MKRNNDFTSPIVNALQNEYNELFARTRSIDTRASILITILLAALPFYFEILNWVYLKECFTCQYMSFRDLSMILSFGMTIITLFTSLFFCVIVLCCRKYYIFPAENYDGFNLKEYEDADVTVNQNNTAIIASYTNCIIHNKKLVETKAKKFIVAIITTSLYVLFVVASVLINLL